MVLKRPKLNTEEHTKEHTSSAHYNSLSTTQRPRQTPSIILQDISLEVGLLSSYLKLL